MNPSEPKGIEIHLSLVLGIHMVGLGVGKEAGRTGSEDAAPPQQKPRDSGPACLESQPAGEKLQAEPGMWPLAVRKSCDLVSEAKSEPQF